MAPGDEYTAVGGGGKLKLKGASKVKDGRVERKKKKKDYSNNKREDASATTATGEKTDLAITTTVEHRQDVDDDDDDDDRVQYSEEGLDGNGGGDEGSHVIHKTEAERRYEEQRKRRLNDRLKREGVKTHKERVEELNRYLSTLSEHHDMPKIGPG